MYVCTCPKSLALPVDALCQSTLSDLWKKFSKHDNIVEMWNNTPALHVTMISQSNFTLLYFTNEEHFPSHTTIFHHKTTASFSVKCINSWIIHLLVQEWLHFSLLVPVPHYTQYLFQLTQFITWCTYTYAVSIDTCTSLQTPWCGGVL